MQTKLVYLIPLRLFVGLSFIMAGHNKIKRGDFGGGYADNLVAYVNSNLENSYGFFRAFLESTVLPNPELFSILYAWNELLFGTSILLGLCTRVGASFGMFAMLMLTSTTGRGLWLPGMDAAYFYALLTLFLANAGRLYGIDAYIHRRWPRWPLS